MSSLPLCCVGFQLGSLPSWRDCFSTIKCRAMLNFFALFSVKYFEHPQFQEWTRCLEESFENYSDVYLEWNSKEFKWTIIEYKTSHFMDKHHQSLIYAGMNPPFWRVSQCLLRCKLCPEKVKNCPSQQSSSRRPANLRITSPKDCGWLDGKPHKASCNASLRYNLVICIW